MVELLQGTLISTNRVSPDGAASPCLPVKAVSLSSEEVSFRRSIAIRAGFSDTIPNEANKLRSLQCELYHGLIGFCPLERLREWLTVSLILGEVLVASRKGDLQIPWLTSDVKFTHTS